MLEARQLAAAGCCIITFGVCIAGGMNLLDTIIEGSAASPAEPPNQAPAAGALLILCSGTATANCKMCEVPLALYFTFCATTTNVQPVNVTDLMYSVCTTLWPST